MWRLVRPALAAYHREMGPLELAVGRRAAEVVVHETFAELTGRSTKKWGVAIVAFAIGVVVAVIVIRRRGGKLAVELDQVEFESLRT